MNQQPSTKTFKTLPILIIIVVLLAIGVGVYFYFTQTEEKVSTSNVNSINISGAQECTYVSNTCLEGYYCYHEVSGGLSPEEGPLPIETIGGDQMCHKLCETDMDCTTGEICVTKDIRIEDYIEIVSFCMRGENTNVNTVDTSDWLTYENEKYNFTFKYPRGWVFEEFEYNPDEEFELTRGGDRIVVSSSETTESFMVCPDERGPGCIPYQDGEWDLDRYPITVGQYNGTQVLYTPTDENVIQKKKIFLEGFSEPWTQAELMLTSTIDNSFETVEEIFKTFQIIDPVSLDTSDWHEQTITIQGKTISFLLPVNWSYNASETTGSDESDWIYVYDNTEHTANIRFAYYFNNDPTLADWAAKKQKEINERIWVVSSTLTAEVSDQGITMMHVATKTRNGYYWAHDYYYLEINNVVIEVALGDGSTSNENDLILKNILNSIEI